MKPMAPPALSVGKVAQFVHGQWRGHRDRRCPLARAASRPRPWRGGRTWLLTATRPRGTPRGKSRVGVTGRSGARTTSGQGQQIGEEACREKVGVVELKSG